MSPIIYEPKHLPVPFLPIFVDSCGQVRFSKREAALFIVLKLSATDATLDDPTIRCRRTFIRDGDCAGIKVANLYPLRSVDSLVMWAQVNPLGRERSRWSCFGT
jgi:hypothetical protein